MEFDAWIDNQKCLLKTERDEEVAQQNEMLAADASGKGNHADQINNSSRRRHAVFPLAVTELSVGLFGRTMCRLQRYGGKAVRKENENYPRLPANRLSPGDIVTLRPVASNIRSTPSASSSSDKLLPQFPSGVIKYVRDHSVLVIFEANAEMAHDDIFRGSPGPLRLDLLGNEVTYKRLTSAVQSLTAAAADANHPAARLIAVAIGKEMSSISSTPIYPSINFFTNLNESQRKAIAMALSTKDFCVIHGPPGTGKTTTVVELIRQLVSRGDRVLAVAPSNIAVDNLAERLSVTPKGQDRQLRLLRVGHPARITPMILKNTLEAVTSQGDESLVVADIQREIQEHYSSLSATDKKTGRFVASRKARHRVYQETKLLRKELKKWEDKARERAFNNTDVVFATTIGVAGRALRFNGEAPFDAVVIDEAAQALEAESWISILKSTGGRCILAGDHCQLPPTITSESAREGGLGITLFDRLVKNPRSISARRCSLPQIENVPVCLLNVQYRMNEVISNWASQEMYDNKLLPASDVAKRTLSDIPSVAEKIELISSYIAEGQDNNGGHDYELTLELLQTPFVLIDTAGLSLVEISDEDSGSKANPGEAHIVSAYLSKIIGEAQLNPSDIAIITPYSAQVSMLKEYLEDHDEGKDWLTRGLEVRTVDGFQGREKELVVLSMVRSNLRKQVGFLADERRINVAVTRAKRQVVLVCDSETVGSNEFLSRLLRYIENAPSALSISALELAPSTFYEEGVLANADERFVESTPKKIKAKKSKPKQQLKADEEDSRQNRKSQFRIFMRSLHDRWNHGRNLHKEIASLRDLGAPLHISSDGSFSEWAFPTTFSSFDRHLIHELAEAFDLGHESHGSIEDNSRYVVVMSRAEKAVEKTFVDGVMKVDEVEVDDPNFGLSQSEIKTASHELQKQREIASSILACEPSESNASMLPNEGVSLSSKQVNNSAPTIPVAAASTMHMAPAPNEILRSLHAEREARQKARSNSMKSDQSLSAPDHMNTQVKKNKNKNKKKKKKKKGGGVEKKKNNDNQDRQDSRSATSAKTASSQLDELDDMAFLDAMVAENQARIKSQNKPKNWIKAEAQKWRISPDGRLSGSRKGALTAAQRSDKAKLLRNKIAKSKNNRAPTKTKKGAKKNTTSRK